MNGRNIIKLIFFLALQIGIADAAYYDTLPQGVRNFTYRFVQTGEISGNYNSSGNFKGYNLNVNINADAISGINAAVDAYLGTLSAADLAAFSFGTFEGSASSKLMVQGFGGGYGITNQLTVYAQIPFYTAEVDLHVRRTAKGRTSNDGSLIQLDNLPDVDTRLIQSLIVNYYEYKPLGMWKATDFGDLEFGFLYQLKKWKDAGLLMSMGAVAPTGKVDDPDILQDISFGDGQWDAFYELGGGGNVFLDWSVDTWTRLTYQFPYEANIRLPSSAVFPLTTRKGNAQIKLGNKVQSNLQGTYHFSDQWASSLVYTFEYKEPDTYKSPDSISNGILQIDTEKISHVARLNVNFSTVDLYKKKKFVAPLNFTLSGQTIFAGKNVPYYQRVDFEIALYF